MTTLEKLESEMRICDVHALRLSTALKYVEKLFPLTSQKFENLQDNDFAFLDLMSNRFAKLQDTIGRKLFPLLLMALNDHEERDSFIDRLHKLEKLNVLEDPSLWDRMRKVRNEIAHDYPEDSDQKISKIRHCFDASLELLSFWEGLKKIIAQRTAGI
jgi:hypothetical protein